MGQRLSQKLILSFERRRPLEEVYREIRPSFLMLKKRIFLRKTALQGVNSRLLLYHQAVNNVLSYQLMVPARKGLYLGALQARIELGPLPTEPVHIEETYYGQLERFLSDELLQNFEKEFQREREDWLLLLALRQKSVAHLDSVECRVEYLKILLTLPSFGSSVYKVRHIGFWHLPETINVDIYEDGLHFANVKTGELLRTIAWAHISHLDLITSQQQFLLTNPKAANTAPCFIDRLTIVLKDSLPTTSAMALNSAGVTPRFEPQLTYLFESHNARDIALMIAR